MTGSRAWLLDFGRGLQAAVGLHEIFQVLLSVELFQVPCTPVYCSEVFILRKRILPVLDIPSLLEGKRFLSMQNEIIGIAAYQDIFKKAMGYAGLRLATLPVNIIVSDEQACTLPRELAVWQPFVYSCFYHEGQAIPVLDLETLFCR
jgi:chemotaxis signal transduction protein